jgi:hypothetical protein
LRATIVNKAPADWLKDLGEPAGKVAEILMSFDKSAALNVYTYRAAHTFLRFHSPRSRCRIYDPNYWADGSAVGSAFGRAGQFDGWLSDGEIGRIAKNHYRDIAAICHNWNPLEDSTLWKIELRGAETVEGLEGAAAPQPTFAPEGGSPATASVLRGGATQVYLNPRTPFICTPVNWTSL